MGLIEAAGGGQQSIWCCIDYKGGITIASEAFQNTFNIDELQNHNIFQYNPEWNYMKWQEVYGQLDNIDPSVFSTKYVTHDGIIKDCRVAITRFQLENISMVLYKIIPDSNDINKNEKSQQENQLADYDSNSPNIIIYFNEVGELTWANNVLATYLSKAISAIKVVNELFLDTDLGTILDSTESLNEEVSEINLRLILKSRSGLKEGYGRIVRMHSTNVKGVFRCEFIEKNRFSVFGEMMDDVKERYNQLKEETELAKTLIAEELLEDFSFENIVTKSQAYKKVLKLVAQVADTDTTVLITGETGTGKELLCNAIYRLSDRSDKIIIKVNCAAIPRDLIESILFGHEKGAFTGADELRIGKFELAHGGTIFLDEIGELPLDLQPKLLRVLQEKEIERIGNVSPKKIDVRVIAATNRNLENLVEEGKFRQDLFYRLQVFPIVNLPLRERKEDIPLLIQHFIRQSNKLTGKNVSVLKDKDLSVLLRYDYPGNVRELENIIHRAVLLSETDVANLDFLVSGQVKKNQSQIFLNFDDMVRKHITDALEMAKGKITGDNSASSYLGINGKTLASKMRKYNIKYYKKLLDNEK